MKTAKESLEIYLVGNMNTCTLTPSAIEDLMKTYAKYVLDTAAEKAKAKLVSNTEAVWHTDFWAEVDKQSILSLKDQI